jgi:murein tripeptide amidase MpaA
MYGIYEKRNPHNLLLSTTASEKAAIYQTGYNNKIYDECFYKKITIEEYIEDLKHNMDIYHVENDEIIKKYYEKEIAKAKIIQISCKE